MKLRDIFLSMTVSSVAFTACTDVLNVAPDGTLTMEEIYADPDRVEALLNTCYMNIPQKGYAYRFFEPAIVSASDDGWTSEDGTGGNLIYDVYKDNLSASSHAIRDYNSDDVGGSANGAYWSRFWTQIRLCSQFLECIETAAVKSEASRDRLRAEAHLLRAFYYSELVKWFGKLPILDHTIPFDTDFSILERQSVYEVARFVMEDCDAALRSSELPWRITTESEGLRMTKALAWALKSTIILYAASPLHNEGQNHWEEAYQTCKQAVSELKANGYELFKTCTNPTLFGDYGAAAYHQLACQAADYSAAPRDRETIYQHISGGLFVWHIGYIGSNMSNTYKCGTCPTQELIDAYETTDGEPVLDPARPYLDERHLEPNYNAQNRLYRPDDPYKNRDPRMTATAMVNGDILVWDNEEVTVETFTGGAHAPSFDQSNRSASRTGYYHRKMVTPRACGVNQINNAPFKYYRLAGILLDYAEAAAEAGHPDEARAAVNEVRARVGMPPLPAGLSDGPLILRIQNERRVELAWEEHRYFDLRRRQKPDGDLSATCKWLTAMVITRNPDGTFAYRRSNILTTPRGGWQNRDLLLPLPLAEVARLEPLTGKTWQNPGW
ncbi:MAG: RagB/SusD family nutrient uptake outer membrane protein [Tannerella sp.]|nr:RagB/SusD family nutrient uptake outer membrane protein [Tannerella sp.]